jgi:RimJ/RimL family protein N-acetyltransferase
MLWILAEFLRICCYTSIFLKADSNIYVRGFDMNNLQVKERTTLSEKPILMHLNGRYVRLEPLIIERDAQPLFEMSNGSAIQFGDRSMEAYDSDELIWRYMFDGPFETLDKFVASLRPQINASNGCCLCVFDVATKRQIGVVNLMNNFPAHLKIELGGIWYSPIVQKTLANTEATYLMLKYCFELGYRRVEWKCHSLNERSRRAALRLGFKFEGIQESHMIVKDCNRDTAWFRLLNREWPEVQQNLEKFLNNLNWRTQ